MIYTAILTLTAQIASMSLQAIWIIVLTATCATAINDGTVLTTKYNIFDMPLVVYCQCKSFAEDWVRNLDLLCIYMYIYIHVLFFYVHTNAPILTISSYMPFRHKLTQQKRVVSGVHKFELYSF